ncbi:MAG: hypothetical protein COT74_09350 [Bdellovibrionales bacterium CG10_big_fil_rev_8_21_14_0_10_45_34]|nr:MAG: hypothetical protein COT74_09350 [Bdellovibrionales bacterium CG10_big_fil_rev_8_21_14_0_10_45_34]
MMTFSEKPTQTPNPRFARLSSPITTFFLTFFVVALGGPAKTADAPIPKKAQEILDSLPGKKITLDFVLMRAIQTSESFRQVASQILTTKVGELQASALLDTQFEIGASKLLNQNEPTSPFAPNRIEGYLLDVSAKKYFQSGTAVSVGVSHGHTAMLFPNPSIRLDPFYESRITLGLSQSLWKDFFGLATRAQLEAAELQTKAAVWQLITSIEDWAFRLSQVFYQAWLSKQQVLTARENVTRRKRLVEINRIKLNRGTSEKPEALQIESAYLKSQTDAENAEQMLGDVWRNLVISLKLPDELVKIDPTLTPIVLDEPYDMARSVCESINRGEIKPESSAKVLAAIKQYESAVLTQKAARNFANPDLKVSGQYIVNGVDGSVQPSVEDTTAARYPHWVVGLRLSMPLGFWAEEANLRQATAQRIRSEAMKNQALEQFTIDGLNLCSDLSRSKVAMERAERANNNQNSRAVLEESRFRLGRINTLQVIQAGDESAFAQLDYHRSQVDFRIAAWKVLLLTQNFKKHLEHLIGQKFENEEDFKSFYESSSYN